MIIDLLLAEGLEPRLVASTNGGEYASPCPVCGGKDRFRSWPEKDRWYCRGCEKSGDLIEYFRHVRGMPYPEAFRSAGREPSRTVTLRSVTGKPAWQPRSTTLPPILWQEKARAFVAWCHDLLLKNEKQLRWLLEERGITVESVRQFQIGWNPKDLFRLRQSWGMPMAMKTNGCQKHLWLPSGLVIPVFMEDRLARVKIRRPDPGDGPRYISVGSDGAGATTPLIRSQGREYLVLVESELDAVLLHQEVGDLAGVVAIGSASYRPDTLTVGLLEKHRDRILLALDADKAGGSSVWRFWLKNFQAFRWPPIGGKDPGEMHQSGTPLREWLLAGLEAMRENSGIRI